MPTVIIDGDRINVHDLIREPPLPKLKIRELRFRIDGRGPNLQLQREVPITFSSDGTLQTGVFRLIGCKIGPEASSYRFVPMEQPTA